MTLEIIMAFVVTMALSTILVPIINYVGKKMNIVAKMNKRTVHKKEITRIGGYAIYISFIIGAVFFLKTDPQINVILISGFLVFMVGLYDDVHDLSPKIKLVVELVAAGIVIGYGGIYLKGFDFLPASWPAILPTCITILWIVGITNAINLIDGLDGLSAGISIIVLVTISMTSLTSGRTDIASLSLTLAGAIMGFLFFNFHPAKIFMGDSGALFIGFMISVISLLGFGYNVSTFFTLGAPIVVLMVPIMDTLIAIVRRKVHRKKFSEADRKHLHHNLMFKLKLGHTKSVLVLYGVTILFSLSSYIYLYDSMLGTIMFLILMFIFELFVEMTNMIGRKYKPLLTILNIFIKSEHLPQIKTLEKYRAKKTEKRKYQERMIAFVLCIVIFLGGGYYMLSSNHQAPIEQPKTTPYIASAQSNSLLKEIYESLDHAYQNNQKEEECKLVAAYFVCNYLTFFEDTDSVGGLEFVYPSLRDDFESYALKTYYVNRKEYPDLAVEDYQIISFSPSKISIEGLENNKYYNVLVSYQYNQDIETLNTTASVALVLEENRYYVVGIDVI